MSAPRPRYKRRGKVDPVSGEFIPATAEELEQARLDRKVTVGAIILFGILIGVGVLGYWLGTMVRIGVLS